MGVPIDQARRGNVDVFVTLTTDKAGVIQGEASDPNFKGQIEITGWSWGVASPTDVSTGMARGRRQYNPLKLYKKIDAATCPLASALATNQNIKELKLSARKAGGAKVGGMTYLEIKIKKGRVTRIDLEFLDASTPDSGREVIEIAYQEIEISYTPQDTVGLSAGTKVFSDQLLAQS